MVYRSSVDTCPTQSQIICIRVQGLRYSEITLHFPIFHVVTGGMFNHLCLTRTCQGGLRQSAQRGSREKHQLFGALEASQQPGKINMEARKYGSLEDDFSLGFLFHVGFGSILDPTNIPSKHPTSGGIGR